jgi:hypothetical protein
MRSLHTEAINHEPAICAMQTGNQIGGRPCLGSWASYGLGSMNSNLPTFVVLIATPTNREQEQAISSRLWSSGYLPGEHAGVSFRSKGDPILFINNPPGVPDSVRKRTIEGLNALNEINLPGSRRSRNADPHQQYEMAFRMQPVPDLTDHLQRTRRHLRALRPEEAKKPGSFANSVLSPADSPSVACASSRSTIAAGTSTTTSARRMQEPVPRYRPAHAALIPISNSAACSMTPSSSGAVSLVARSTARACSPRQLRSRPPPALLQHVDGRRRCPKAARSTARPMTSATTSSKTPSTSATSTPRAPPARPRRHQSREAGESAS